MSKKILFISRNLPPLTGGMERLAHRLHDGLADHYDITLIGPKGCSKYLHRNLRTLELPSHPIIFIPLSTLLAIWVSRSSRFEICIGTNGLMALASFFVKKIFKTPTMILIHGLDLVAPHPLYQLAFIPLIGDADKIISNSSSTKTIALGKGLLERKISIINPGVDLPTPDIQPPLSMVLNKMQENTKIILFVGRILKRKGLSSFIRNCLGGIVDHYQGDCKLIVVGDSPQDAVLKDAHEANDVNLAINDTALRPYIKFLGKVDDAELRGAYQLADILILPLIEMPGDIEGFGMVILEAASFGVPTVAFNIGGVADAIVSKTGVLVAKNDYPAFSKSVIEVINDKERYSPPCKERAYTYRWDNYTALIHQEIEHITAS